MPNVVLNVGGGANPWLPANYLGWQNLVLDINPETNPHLCMDARNLTNLAPNQFDAVFCSHNLEHYNIFDLPIVLKGMLHVIKSGGHLVAIVPSIRATFEAMFQSGDDLDDVFYSSPAGPITYHDVIYGYSKDIEKNILWQQHQSGFSLKRMKTLFEQSGFERVVTQSNGLDLHGLGFKA